MNSNPTNTATQPKPTSGMVLSVQPSIEQAQLEAHQNKHKHQRTLRLRGGGAGRSSGDLNQNDRIVSWVLSSVSYVSNAARTAASAALTSSVVPARCAADSSLLRSHDNINT